MMLGILDLLTVQQLVFLGLMIGLLLQPLLLVVPLQLY